MSAHTPVHGIVHARSFDTMQSNPSPNTLNQVMSSDL
jgi:hypothetical protein